ncbi:MAG: hypothetical protein M3063_10655 [Actinomycetota bacterium]|nr:hypothetical protein [Actinomycetota bacterium]
MLSVTVSLNVTVSHGREAPISTITPHLPRDDLRIVHVARHWFAHDW